MNPVRLIQRKRDGGRLADEEIAFLVRGHVAGTIPDYQMSALTMAVFFQGMDRAETVALTREMLHSGDRLSWPAADGPFVDKHSTGGIGDKISLPLAPLLACCGAKVPMLSGRGLGATGGTLDKMEAIPGCRAQLEPDELRRVVAEVGCVIAGQSASLVPADRKLYALRDATATVPSIPLIVASILSKKLAEGLDALVLDVKWGSGAFMKTLPAARELALALTAVGTGAGLPTRAWLTDMNQPLGRLAGNAVEVRESLDILEGGGPADVRELVLTLAGESLQQVKLAADAADARAQLEKALSSGAARDRFERMVHAQGGRLAELPAPAPRQEILAARGGWLTAVDGDAIGFAITALGGGRMAMTDILDPSVGVETLVRLGDPIHPGQPLAAMFAHARGAADARQLLENAFVVSDAPLPPPPLLVERLAATG